MPGPEPLATLMNGAWVQVFEAQLDPQNAWGGLLGSEHPLTHAHKLILVVWNRFSSLAVVGASAVSCLCRLLLAVCRLSRLVKKGDGRRG